MRRWTIPMLAIAIAITALFTLLPVTAQAATSGYYTYETFNGGVMITDVKIGISGNVSIPTTLGGKPVLAIGSRAFQGCTNLTGITIPNSVTSIGVSAFSNCTNLTTVKMGNGITELNGFTFAQCYKLTDVTLPNNLTVMASSEFQDCTSLKSITIPDTVTSIGQNVFTGCSSLEDITIPFVGASKKIADNTYQYPLGYLFGTTTYTGGVETTQYYRASGSTSDISGTYYIPASLKSVTVTGGEVAYGAFYNCAGLQSITIPDTATSISARTFYGCSGLESFVLPEGVVSIGSQAFGGCSSLTDMRIPGSVTEIGSSAFFGCVGLTDLYITDPSAWCRINFVGSQASNPAQLADRMHIVDADENEIQEVVLESSVTTIPQYAFHGCSHLISITISDGVTDIGDYAFSGCSELTNITISDGVTDIGDYAFSGCSELTNIIIPNSVTHIGKNVFSGCSKLERMTIPFVGESRKTSSDTYQYPLGYLFGESSYSGGVATEQHYFGADTLRSVSSTYYIPASLKEVAVMDGKILYGAFMNCTGLTGVVIGDGVSSIGDRAFMNCTELTDISISDSVTFIDSGAFNSCSKLACVVLPSGYFNTIWENTFYTCNSLVSIAIPDTVTSVRKAAFYNCNSLCHVLYGGTQAQKNEMLVSGFNERLTNTFWHYEATGDEVYYRKTCAQEGWYCSICERFLTSTATGIECQYSASVIPPTCCDEGFTTHICTVCGDRYIDNYTEPTGIHTYEGAFCTQCGACVLTFYAVDGGASYSVLGCDKAFTGALEIPASYEGIPVRVINSGAFRDCTGLTSVTIPNSVTTIGASAFYGCSQLTNIVIPHSVREIGYAAFEGCSQLSTALIGDGVVVLESNVFAECRKLTRVTAGSNLEIIRYHAFFNCNALEQIILPATLTTVDPSAFIACSALTDVYYNGTKIQKAAIFIDSSNEDLLNATWHCVDLTFELNEDGQSYYLKRCGTDVAGYVEIPATYEGLPVTAIGDGAFHGCTGLTGVTIPDSVTSIGNGAFINCSSLESIELPSGLTELGHSALDFRGDGTAPYNTYNNALYLGNAQNPYMVLVKGIDHTITSCTIHPQTKFIQNNAFHGYTNLISIVIPNTVLDIGDSAFSDCSGLTDLTIGTSVTKIGDHAFSGCSNLQAITIPDSVVSIGSHAFYECRNVKTITVGTGLKTTGTNSFLACGNDAVYFSDLAAWCQLDAGENGHPGRGANELYLNGELLTHLIIPEGVSKITAYSFCYYDKLVSITIPATVTEIGNHAFRSCTNVTTIYYDGTSEQWETVTKGVDWDWECTYGLICLGDPQLVESLTFGLLRDGQSYILISCDKNYAGILQIPATYKDKPVTAIGDSAFNGCNQLTGVIIPLSVTTINTGAFSDCGSLDHVLYTGTEEQWSNVTITSGNDDLIGASVWHYEATGDELYFRTVCTKEGLYCSACERFLTETALDGQCRYDAVVIPGTCTEQGYTSHTCSVCGDRYIDNYTEPTGIHTYEGAFCTQCGACVLTFYAVDGGASYSVLGCDKAFTGALEIPASYEGIPVRVINSGAFRDCTGLTSVTIPNSVTTIGASAFYGCTNLETVTLSTSIKAIPMQAFWGCTKLTNVTIPNGVTEIDYDAFMNCSSLTSITIPDTVTKMGESVFEGCTALQKATIGSGIDWRIDARTFYGCTALKEVTIPDTVMAIAASAFSGCSGLTDVYYSGTLAQKEAITMASDNDPLLSATWHCEGEPEYTAGDLTGDGKINSLDGLMLMRYLNGWDVNIAAPEAMDVNADGKVNSLDGLMLMRYLNGWDVILGKN